ncbi:hypothetical protein K440DRAFT_265158 [Wilcoxina mikolae CBS 423.85]|nr:hypothetical protein K440DRAFT_265158 [Wilcoxina mikolae CBS 423.85]
MGLSGYLFASLRYPAGSIAINTPNSAPLPSTAPAYARQWWGGVGQQMFRHLLAFRIHYHDTVNSIITVTAYTSIREPASQQTFVEAEYGVVERL